ncbi:DUF3592 domain-containing protein [candidate division KSB1 bacterium]
MTGYIFYAAGVFALWLTAIHFIRSGNLKRRSTPLFVTAIAIIVVGVLLTLDQYYEYRDYRAMMNWDTIEGTIISSEVIGTRAFRPEVVYMYNVSNFEYSGVSDLQLPGFGGRRSKYDAAEKLARQYPAGNAVSVYYNPDDPSVSRLTIKIPVEVYLKFGLGGFLLFAGFGTACAIVISKKTD